MTSEEHLARAEVWADTAEQSMEVFRGHRTRPIGRSSVSRPEGAGEALAIAANAAVMAQMHAALAFSIDQHPVVAGQP